MHLMISGMVAATSLWLAPAVSLTTADPREDLDAFIPHAVSLLESKQYRKALEALIEPETLKGILEKEKKSLEEFAIWFGTEKAPRLLDMLRAIRGTKPELSDEGTKAIFRLEEPVNGRRSIRFMKTGKHWSVVN